MKNISFLLLSLVMLVFAGCSAVPVESNSSEIVEIDPAVCCDNPEGNENNLVDSEVIVEVDENSVKVEVDNNTVTGVVNDDGTVVVESGETSASGSVADDGTIVVESNVDTSGLADIALSEWCIPGQAIESEVDGSTSVSFVISGIEMFKGEEYCLSTGIVTAGELDVPASIYAKDANSEFWFVTEVFGQSVEKKIQPTFK